MNEIKFRGKNPYTNEWVFGYFVLHDNYPQIWKFDKQNVGTHPVQIDIDTLGQFIELEDLWKKDIYQGDIIQLIHPYKSRKFKGEVIWMNYKWGCKDFYFTHFDNPDDIFSEGTEYIEIIGSIHDKKKS